MIPFVRPDKNIQPKQRKFLTETKSKAKIKTG